MNDLEIYMDFELLKWWYSKGDDWYIRRIIMGVLRERKSVFYF